jgi:hypothetical protein
MFKNTFLMLTCQANEECVFWHKINEIAEYCYKPYLYLSCPLQAKIFRTHQVCKTQGP